VSQALTFLFYTTDKSSLIQSIFMIGMISEY